MREAFRQAPPAIRRLWKTAIVLLSATTVLFGFTGYLVFQDLMVKLASYDPFAGGSLELTHTPVVDFLSGLLLSMPATLAGFAIVSSVRLLRPYRPRSRSTAIAATYGTFALVAVFAGAAAFGAKPFSWELVGEISCALTLVPLLPGLHHKVTKAWSIELPVPLPQVPTED